MTPERAVLAASLALIAAAAGLLPKLRDDYSRLSRFLDAIDPCPDLGTEHDQ